MKKMFLLVAFTTIASLTTNTVMAQTFRNNESRMRYYNGQRDQARYQAEADYYRVFNQKMKHVYNGAQYINQGATNFVNGASRFAGSQGNNVRRSYNKANSWIQSNVQLPKRYQYRP